MENEQTSNYGATIAPIKNLRKHSNADRLMVGDVQGFPVIVGLETKEGDLGILIREGSQLSKEFALANNLFSSHPDTGEKLSGYLSDNARVKALKLRGEKSEGLFLPLTEVIIPKACGASKLPHEACSLFDEIGKHKFVWKYETPAQIRAKQAPKAQSKSYANFQKHYSTPQLRDNVSRLASMVAPKFIYTEKVHGTSGRTARVPIPVPVPIKLSLLQKLWNSTIGRFAFAIPTFYEELKIQKISGTRHCVLDPEANGEKGMGYRQTCHDLISEFIEPGFSVYYEIVGFTEHGSSIMGAHPVDKLKDSLGKKEAKEFFAEYGKTPQIYSYGCDPDGYIPGDENESSAKKPRFRIFVYRMTRYLDSDKKPKELTWSEIEQRIKSWGCKHIEVVPVLARNIGLHPKSEEEILDNANLLTRGPSTLDRSHIREGICIRAEHIVGDQTVVAESVKHKGFVFCTLEGIRANDPTFIDLEAVS